MSINVDEWKGKGRRKKRWMDCVKENIRENGLSANLITDKKKWK